MSTLTGLFCLLFIRATHAITVSLCNNNTYLEVKEGRDDNRFVCTGLTPQQTVNWFWGQTFILACTPSSCDVNYYYPAYFRINRALVTESDITVNATTFSNLDITRIGSLTCQVSNENKDTCDLDVVYPAENPKCQIEFSGDTWEVTGWCNISKVRSKRNRYGCYIYQTPQQLSASLVGSFIMSLKNTSETNYFAGTCEIRNPLPPEGQYNYSVIIIPGEVQVIPFFSGSNEIRRPSESPTHNCSHYVTEGENVNCFCYSSNLGLPSGSLIWNGTTSSKLKIDSISRTYNGISYTCTLMWNNAGVQNVIYTMTVNYASRVLGFKIDNKADDIVTVKENTNVSVVCQAEGRPLPTLRLFNRSSDNHDVELTAANNGLELEYIMSAVKCETTGTYSCKSENGVTGDEKRILLIVFCAPRQTTQDSYSTTFNGVEARLKFQIIASPTPDSLNIFYIGSSLNDTTVTKVEYKNTVNYECTSDNFYRYMVTCTVTLLNETIFSTGVYHAVFSNGLGNVSLTFEIKEHADTPGQSKPEVAGPVAGGVVGAFVAIALAVGAVIFIMRRKRRRHERGSRANPVMTSKTDPQRSLEIYDQLQRGDINSPSVYQTLGAQETSGQGQSQVYEIPIILQENTRETRDKETIYQNST